MAPTLTLVGLTLGLAAAQGGLAVVVVDTLAPETVLDAGFDGRVSALADGAREAGLKF